MLSEIFPDDSDGELVSAGFKMPRKLRDELDEVAKSTDRSRVQVMIHFLRFALKKWRDEQVAKGETRKAKK